MSSVTARYRRRSPPRYRRHLSAVSVRYPPEAEDVPVTPRPHSARERTDLDRNWVHRSLGDLTHDPEAHRPSHFLSELQLRYPEAFHRRLRQRETGRKVFDAGLHVRFEDEVTFASHPDLTTLKSTSLKHLKTCDSDDGHFQGQRSRSRDSLLNSDLDDNSESGSQYRSETLNRLLYEKSPLRKRFEQDRRYDQGLDNEESFEDYFIGRSKERSRNKKFRQRKVLQRKIDNNVNGAIENTYQTTYSIPRTKKHSSSKANLPKSKNSFSYRSIDIETLLANTDVIDTLLAKMNQKVLGPASPADSAIDIDTQSVQSLAMSGKEGNSRHLATLPSELQSLNGGNEGEKERNQTDSESSPGSSASSYARRKDVQGVISGASSDALTLTVESVESESELPDGSPLIHTGLLQLCPTSAAEQKEADELCVLVSNKLETREHSRAGNCDVDVNCDSWDQNTNLSCDSDMCYHGNGVAENNTYVKDGDGAKEKCVDSASLVADSCDNEVKESVKNAGYSADDEDDSQITVVEAGGCHGNNKEEKIVSHRDSDVDSGVGHSSIGTESRSSTKLGFRKSREITHKARPVKPDHSILPSRSDMCTSNGVTVASKNRGLSNPEEIDDTDITLGVSKPKEAERWIAEKYRRARSPLPYRNTGQVTPRYRPLSAPLFPQTRDMQFGIVDISLSNDSLSDLSSELSNCDKGSVSDRSPNHRTQSEPNEKINRIHSDKDITRNTDSDRTMRNSSEIHVSRTTSKPRNSIGSSVESEDSYNSQSSNELDDLEIPSLRSNHERTRPDTDEARNNEEARAHTNEKARYNVITRLGANETVGSNETVNNDITIGEDSENCMLKVDGLDEDVVESRGHYQPVVSSPRMQEKRLKLKNILKEKRGSFNPSEESAANQQMVSGGNVKRIYAKDRTCNVESGLTSGVSDANLHGDQPREKTVPQNIVVPDRLGPAESNGIDQVGSGSRLNNLVNSNTLPAKSPSKIPPAKPARAKRKNLPPDLNLSKYKITAGETNPSLMDPQQRSVANSYHEGSQRSLETNSGESTPSIRVLDSNGLSQRPMSAAPGFSTIDTDIQVMPPASPSSNLAKSRGLSASKVSLLDKMGDFKSATKHKFKAMRKAMSLERGIDTCGVEQNPTGQKPSGPGFAKMKKAPSLKSITSLFKGKKKKKGKLQLEDYQGDEPGSLSKSKQWMSCQTLSPSSTPVGGVTHQAPLGRLLKVNRDGTYMVQLNKPQNGPIGFYIAKGNARFGNGIFVSRFSLDRPEHMFAGLISIGDEIIEINDTFVRDLTLDAVYKLIGGQATLKLKIFPFVARKDI